MHVTPTEQQLLPSQRLPRPLLALLGAFAVFVFVYCLSVHVSIILLAVAYPSYPYIVASLMTPNLLIAHIIVSIFGPLVAVSFSIHAFRNPRLNVRRRFFWLGLCAIGYGLVFYWYNYLAHVSPRKEAA